MFLVADIGVRVHVPHSLFQCVVVLVQDQLRGWLIKNRIFFLTSVIGVQYSWKTFTVMKNRQRIKHKFSVCVFVCVYLSISLGHSGCLLSHTHTHTHIHTKTHTCTLIHIRAHNTCTHTITSSHCSGHIC